MRRERWRRPVWSTGPPRSNGTRRTTPALTPRDHSLSLWTAPPKPRSTLGFESPISLPDALRVDPDADGPEPAGPPEEEEDEDDDEEEEDDDEEADADDEDADADEAEADEEEEEEDDDEEEEFGRTETSSSLSESAISTGLSVVVPTSPSW